MNSAGRAACARPRQWKAADIATLAPADATDIPRGFSPLPLTDGFIGHNGPIYGRRDEDGGVTFGLRVQPIHCNPMGICHGGWIATMCDMVLPLGARLTAGLDDNFLLTVHMSIDYLGAAPLGCWLEGRADVLRRTKRLVFVQGLLSVEGDAVTRASGVFRIGPPAPPLTL